jgi:hypothetical protein
MSKLPRSKCEWPRPRDNTFDALKIHVLTCFRMQSPSLLCEGHARPPCRVKNRPLPMPNPYPISEKQKLSAPCSS